MRRGEQRIVTALTLATKPRTRGRMASGPASIRGVPVRLSPVGLTEAPLLDAVGAPSEPRHRADHGCGAGVVKLRGAARRVRPRVLCAVRSRGLHTS